MSVITIERKILEKNDEIAAQNRRLLARHGIFSLNLVSSPGSGKTSLLERTFERLAVLPNAPRAAVIEGDIQTDIDARRLARFGVPTVQIVTRGGCHLDAALVRDALSELKLDGVALLFIENVGNLVCPANYDLGETMKAVVVSTTEGDDKPLKYPGIFRNAEVLVINKTDLIPHVDCKIPRLTGNALDINPALALFETSCKTGTGIDAWRDWLVHRAEQLR